MMITLKSTRSLWPYFSRNVKQIVEKNVRFLGSGKLVDLQVNNKTGVYTVTLQRPPVNSLNMDVINELTSAMLQVEKNGARGMILTSSTPGIFSAGFDLLELYKPNQDRLKAYWTAIQDMWLHLYSSAYSTVAVIPGHCPGAGCLIAISCDYRIMVRGNFGIGLNETQLGLAAPSWFMDTFTNVLPKRIAEMALISGKMFQVDEAKNVGLVDEIAADPKDGITKAEDYLKNLAKINSTAMAHTKLTIRYDAIKRLQDTREHDLRVFLKFINDTEVQKGLEMYLERLKKK